MGFDSPDRRLFLGGLACVALAGKADAADSRILKLLAESKAHGALPGRIEFISRALIGSPYRAETLIGGAKKPEVFVTRDDVFDCVTYCEVVMAAAMAGDAAAFEPLLRKIRYRNGVVGWRERNHDFADWCAQNTANGVGKPVLPEGVVEIRKTMTQPAALGRREYALKAIPRAVLMKTQLTNGDVIGFVSSHASLDYFHCGFAMMGEGGALRLRHASQSRRRVLEEPIEKFLDASRVKWVTVLRPQERA